MRYTGLLALAAFGRLVAGVTPEESKCRFRGVRLMFFDDSDVNLYNMLITFREQVKQTDQAGVVSWIRVEDGQGVNCIAHGSDGAEIFLRGIHDTIGDVNPPQPITHVSCTECPDDFVDGSTPPSTSSSSAPGAPAPAPPSVSAPAPTSASAPPPAPAGPAPPASTTTTVTTAASPNRVQAPQSSSTLAVVTVTALPNGAPGAGAQAALYAAVAGLGVLFWAGLA